VDAVGWFAIDDALRTMTFEGEKAVVQQAVVLLTTTAQ
jgi:hypothetical protein